jgi:WD40 repeat protein
VVSGKLLSKRDSPTRIRDVSLSTDGKQVAIAMRIGADDPFARGRQGVRVIDADSGKTQVEFHLPSANVAAMNWADEGTRLSIVGEDATSWQVEIATASIVSEFALPHPVPDPRTGMLVSGGIRSAALFRDGRNLISAGGKGDIYHWLIGTGDQQWVMPSGSPHIRALAVSPDGRMFAGFCSDGDLLPKKIRMWDVVTRKLLIELDAGPEPADSMAFSPGGTRLVVGYYDGTALVYDGAEAAGKLE